MINLESDNNISILIVCISLVILVGCSQRDRTAINFEYLYTADPVKDAEKFISKKDFRFYGINGTAVNIPLVNYECLDLEKDVIIIQGTSDSMQSYRHSQFNVLAFEYANYYNVIMLDFWITNHMFKCSNPRK